MCMEHNILLMYKKMLLQEVWRLFNSTTEPTGPIFKTGLYSSFELAVDIANLWSD